MNMGKGGDGKVDGRKCPPINVNFRILKWRYVSTIFLAIFCRDILQSIGSWNGHLSYSNTTNHGSVVGDGIPPWFRRRLFPIYFFKANVPTNLRNFVGSTIIFSCWWGWWGPLFFHGTTSRCSIAIGDSTFWMLTLWELNMAMEDPFYCTRILDWENHLEMMGCRYIFPSYVCKW